MINDMVQQNWSTLHSRCGWISSSGQDAHMTELILTIACTCSFFVHMAFSFQILTKRLDL